MQPRRSILMMLALGAVCLRLSAQQSIIVSQPADAGNSGKADKSSHKNSHSSLLDYFSQESDSNRDIHVHAGDFNAPQSFFHNNNSPSFSMPHPVYFSRQSIEAANKDKNWTLLTPAEILGVQTPEEILGINNKDQNLSLDEQFLQRLHKNSSAGATNGGPAGVNFNWQNNDNNDPFANNDSSGWNNTSDNNSPFRRLNSTDGSALSSGRTGSFQPPDPSSGLSRLFNQANTSSSDQQGANSIWTSPFARPSQPRSQTSQEQRDAMQRFRALMEPESSPNKTAMPVRYSSASKSKSASASFFNNQPAYNPAGGSADQLLDNASRPEGLQSLPRVGAPKMKTETTRPAWQAQLPPWMRKGPPQHGH